MQAIFNHEDLCFVDGDIIANLKRRAQLSSTGRYRLCLHRNQSETVQEMIIAMTSDSRIVPHRDPLARSKSYYLIEGEMEVIFFSDSGKIINREFLRPIETGGPVMFRLYAPRYHMPLVHDGIAVFHEIAEGPFSPYRDDYAPWCPSADNRRAFDLFLSELNK